MLLMLIASIPLLANGRWSNEKGQITIQKNKD
jgi:hypothetical protein